MIVVGEDAHPSDVVAAINLATRLGAVPKTTATGTVEVEVPGVPAAVTLTGGVALDTADTKLYLTDAINKAKTILTYTDLPTLLVGGTVEDEAGTKYDYKEYIKIGNKEIKYAQPDTAAGIKEPDYLIKLGTSVGTTAYLIEAWVSFTKQFNASKAVGKEINLFGKTFTIGSETDSSKLVLYGLTGKTTIKAGEEATVTVGEETYTVKVEGIVDSDTAVITVNGVTKEVDEDNTYDFAGVSVYVDDVFYYEVPEKTGSVVVSIGADRYVFQDGQPIKKGTAGAEESVKGTYVSLSTNPQQLSDLKIYFDAYPASPAVDYIKAGSTWTDPVFGIKVAYNGPAPATTEEILIQPGGTNYYTISFTDKYGESATVTWVYDSKVGDGTGESLQDETGKSIHVVENEEAYLNEYLFAVSSEFPHMLRVTEIDTDGSSYCKATLQDVFSGTEYTIDVTSTSTTLVIDGQPYTVTCGQDANGDDYIQLKDDDDTKTVLWPILITQYGAKIALTKPLTLNQAVANATGSVNYTLPTGTVYFREASDGSLLQYSTDGSTWTNITTGDDQSVDITLGRVTYTFQVDSRGKTDPADSNIDSVKIKDIAYPAILLIEEETKAENADAFVFYAVDDTDDDRLELQTPSYTHADGNIYAGVGTESTYVTHYVSEWGTKIVYDTTAAGTATITYPDTQVYHLVAIGENPVWSTTAGTEAGTVTKEYTYEKVVPITTPIAKLDSEVTDADKTTKHLILVGGPCVNDLVAELAAAGKLKYDGEVLTCDAWNAKTAAGEEFGLIELIEDAFAEGKVALVVAGSRAPQTREACNVLMDYEAHATEFAGQVAVKVVEGVISPVTITG